MDVVCWKKNKAKIDFGKQLVSFCDDMGVTKMTASLQQLEIATRTVFSITIQPQSETIIPVILPSNRAHTDIALVEPISYTGKEEYLTARSIVRQRWNRSFCKILNPTGFSIRIRANSIRGFIDGQNISPVQRSEDTVTQEVIDLEKE